MIYDITYVTLYDNVKYHVDCLDIHIGLKNNFELIHETYAHSSGAEGLVVVVRDSVVVVPEIIWFKSCI